MTRVSELLGAGRSFSFEFFPPKDDGTQLTFGHTIAATAICGVSRSPGRWPALLTVS